MPKVGKKLFKSVKKAKKAAKRTGKKMKYTKKKYSECQDSVKEVKKD